MWRTHQSNTQDACSRSFKKTRRSSTRLSTTSVWVINLLPKCPSGMAFRKRKAWQTSWMDKKITYIRSLQVYMASWTRKTVNLHNYRITAWTRTRRFYKNHIDLKKKTCSWMRSSQRSWLFYKLWRSRTSLSLSNKKDCIEPRLLWIHKKRD